MSLSSTLSSFPLLQQIIQHARTSPSSKAIVDLPLSLSVTYSELTADILSLATTLAPLIAENGHEARVVVLCEKGYLVPLAMLATWTAGGLSVPMLPSLPLPEQSYMATNAETSLIITDAKYDSRAQELKGEVKKEGGRCEVLNISLEDIRRKSSSGEEGRNAEDVFADLEVLDGERRAMMLFTSGTTGRPKGVVTRHSALTAQVSAVATSWRWSPSDNLLHILPLNHLHGIIVALLPTLWVGATVELWEKFDGPAIWKRWINEEGRDPITMFFGVPTVYSRLIQAHSTLPPELQEKATKASSTLRLQVSGSAPLPESVKATWEKEGGVGGGQVLLERYGMTETGIIAMTGWENERRIKGHVGFALPGTEIRLWDEENNKGVTEREVAGGVQVRGPPITKEYWRLPEVTAKEFQDGWFKTGDVGVWSADPLAMGQLRILGRSSTDIIKSGGEKISAVEIERAILELEGMKDCAVVGVDDEEWGQVVSVCLVTTRPDVTVADLRKELREVIAPYKLPKKLKIYEGEIPRNNMGKVNKKKLVLEAFPITLVV
ncbi:long-chain acyl-CoA synthetase [Kwoniella heveanensis CBS 569]|nr:long-chain acyl-CoA synthetase [Kwoniella heveanensis CBS 569]